MSLAIECGATSSDAILVADDGGIQRHIRLGSANYQLMDEEKLKVFFGHIRDAVNEFSVHSIGVGMPGVVDDTDVQVASELISKLRPEVDNLWIGNDLETALACVDADDSDAKAIVIAGTGSCCYGTNGKESGKIGFYGHRIGDRGSAYAISEYALRLALRQHERNRSLRHPNDSKEIHSKSSIRILLERVCGAFQNGGRLLYVGAGTSGRLGILDATECPPTFRSPSEWVQGIIAGGFSSIGVAKEGAEDSILDGIEAIDERNVTDKYIVVGIAACGQTPFVWGSIYRAKTLNAFTAFLTFNTELELKIQPDLLISMDLGPEILTGSTRLKCGTATKCILNMISTLAMVKYGKCFENLMVDLNPANEKLRKRSLRIVLLMTSQLKNVDETVALDCLLANKFDIRSTVEELRKNYQSES